jgi:hypothetical protein
MAVVPTNDIVALLEQDHAAIRERLLELENAHPADRAVLFRELTMELSRHEVARRRSSTPPSAMTRAGTPTSTLVVAKSPQPKTCWRTWRSWNPPPKNSWER